MKATPISSSISANLGNYGEAMVEIHKYSVKFMAATLSYFLWASRGGGEQTNYIFHMDYNVRVYWKQPQFPAASLQTWATPEKQLKSLAGGERRMPHARNFITWPYGGRRKILYSIANPFTIYDQTFMSSSESWWPSTSICPSLWKATSCSLLRALIAGATLLKSLFSLFPSLSLSGSAWSLTP